jgi:cytochrome c-type biogenesis protein CcmH/NrfG
MFQSEFCRIAIRFALLWLCLSTAWQLPAIYAQSESVPELKKQSNELIKQQKYTEALPILEKLAIAEPTDAGTHFFLGFALLAQGNITKDMAARKALRIRARNEFIKSKELALC